MSVSIQNPDISPSIKIKDYASHQLGIDLIGICTAEPLLKARQDLEEFLRLGYQGEMNYLEEAEKRTNPDFLLPGVKSVLVIAINYYREKPQTPPDQGRIARYAWGRDYHKVLRKVLKDLQKYLEQEWPDHQHKICVDSAPLMEKAFAERAGLGFYGKNTTLINPKIGSFILLGEILTTLPLQPDIPSSNITTATCGTCTRCLDACPTQALIAPEKYHGPRMDARRCISYITIESKSPIPEEFAEATGNLIAGCDICQEVCPYNKAFAKPLAFAPLQAVRIAGDSIPLEDILRLQNTEQYLARFAGSPLMRPKRHGLVKNALNAAHNAIKKDPSKYGPQFLPLIHTIAESDQSPELRDMAEKVLEKLQIRPTQSPPPTPHYPPSPEVYPHRQ